jgi:type II secretory pathway pseudopilin PulG
MVILLLGILSTFIAGRAGSDFTAMRDAEELLQAIRYTQERAMQHTGDGQHYRISIGGSGYSLLPTPSALVADTLDGSLEGASVSPSGVIAFDGRGKPLCSGGFSCSDGSQNISLSAGGKTLVLTLQPHTGYVSR